MKSESFNCHHFLENLPDAFAYHCIVAGDNNIPSDFIYLEVNAAFEKMIGLKREKLIGKKVTEVLASIEKSEFNLTAIYDQIVSHGEEGARFESHSEFSGYWYEVRTFSDKAGCLAAFFHDITQGKKISQELQGTENQYRDLVNNAGDLIQCVDSTGKFAFVNHSWLSTLGYSCEELENLTLWDIIHPDSLDHCMAAFQEVLDGKAYGDVEAIFVNSQGKKIIVEGNVNVKLDKEGLFEHTRGIFRNVTERKLAEEALKDREEEYHRLYSMLRIMSDTMPDMLWAKDLDRKYIFANQAICNNLLNAKDTTEPIGKNDLYFAKRERKAHPEQPDWHTFGELCMDSDSLTLQEMKPMRFDEYGNVKGKFLYLDVHKAPLYNDQGELVGVVGSARDITDRKRAEEDLKKSEALQQLLMSMATKLINISIEEVEQAIGNMLQELGHFSGLDRVYIFKHDFERGITTNTYEWCAQGITAEIDNLQAVPLDQLSALLEPNQRGEIIIVPRASDLPEDDSIRKIIEPQGIRSLLLLPLVQRNKNIGFVGFDAVRADKDFTNNEIILLRIFAELIANIEERQITDQALHQSEEKYRTLTENVPIGVYRSTPGPEGSFLMANPAVLELFGFESQNELNRIKATDLYQHPPDRADFSEMLLTQGRVNGAELALKRLDGTPIWASVTAQVVYDEHGKAAWFDCTLEDITKRKLAEKALKESEAQKSALLEAIPDMMFLLNKNATFIDHKTGDRNPLLIKPQAFLHKSATEVLPPELARLTEKHLALVFETNEMQIYEYQLEISGEHKSFESRLVPCGDEGALAIVRDITERKQFEERILHMSLHDQLTGLYNRYYLERMMEKFNSEQQLPLSIIMGDLNGLKLVNDTYGHSTGDEMLKKTAAVLTEICRGQDLIARFGGDEFVICMPRTTGKEAQLIGRKIAQAFDKEQIKDVPITFSLGIAIKTDAEQEIAAVLREAENKMNQNKLTENRSGKSSVLTALLKTLAAKSYETEIHTRNMQEVAIKIGEKLGLPDSELHRLSLLITLHDIGKINIPEELLTKSEALSEEEWVTMKKHCETGFRIARATEAFAHVAEDILAHHERWDGSGYPQGLKGEAIPLLARITAVADAYEVMCNGRPYKKTLAPEAIRAEFERCAGSHFDPQVVEIFLGEIYEELL